MGGVSDGTVPSTTSVRGDGSAETHKFPHIPSIVARHVAVVFVGKTSIAAGHGIDRRKEKSSTWKQGHISHRANLLVQEKVSLFSRRLQFFHPSLSADF